MKPEQTDLTAEDVARLRARMIQWRPTRYVRHPEIFLEPPLSLAASLWSYRRLSIGAFSYSFSTFSSNVASVGRYCSIAADVRFGEDEHPTDWLSTSSFTYNPDFIWRDYRAKYGGEFTTFLNSPARYEEGIRIGNDVWIGARAYIKAGVRVGNGAIIGANAVVTRDVNPYAIVAGNPARVIRSRFPEEVVRHLEQLQWWRFAFTDLDGIDLRQVGPALGLLEERVRNGGIAPYAPDVLSLDEILKT